MRGGAPTLARGRVGARRGSGRGGLRDESCEPLNTVIDVTKTSRPRVGGLRGWALFWTLFIGLGAVLGAFMMWLGADTFGMNPMLQYIQRLPLADVLFTTWKWPGVFLLLVNGLPQLGAAILVLLRHEAAPRAVFVAAILLAGWMAVQFVIFPLNPVSTLYLAFAVAEGAAAVLWLRRRPRSAYVARPAL